MDASGMIGVREKRQVTVGGLVAHESPTQLGSEQLMVKSRADRLSPFMTSFLFELWNY